MAKINLQDFYSFYHSDFFIEIPDEVENALLEAERLEKNYIRRRFYNKAHYSLDADDGIEKDILFVSLSPCEIYERKMTAEQLHSAIASLPDKQGNGSMPLLRFRKALMERKDDNRHFEKPPLYRRYGAGPPACEKLY